MWESPPSASVADKVPTVTFTPVAESAIDAFASAISVGALFEGPPPQSASLVQFIVESEEQLLETRLHLPTSLIKASLSRTPVVITPESKAESAPDVELVIKPEGNLGNFEAKARLTLSGEIGVGDFAWQRNLLSDCLLTHSAALILALKIMTGSASLIEQAILL